MAQKCMLQYLLLEILATKEIAMYDCVKKMPLEFNWCKGCLRRIHSSNNLRKSKAWIHATCLSIVAYANSNFAQEQRICGFCFNTLQISQVLFSSICNTRKQRKEWSRYCWFWEHKLLTVLVLDFAAPHPVLIFHLHLITCAMNADKFLCYKCMLFKGF